MKRWWFVVLAVLIGASAFAVMDAAAQHGAPGGPSADAATPEGRRADLAAFRSQFFDVDRAYAESAGAEAERRLQQLEAHPAQLSQVAFELELARIVALADNGHTALFAGPRASHANRVPVRLTPFGENFYVLAASPENADLLGARLVSVEGRAVARLRTAAHGFHGGIPSWRDRYVPYFLESPEQMAAAGLIRNADRARYRFETPGGRRVTRMLAGATTGAPRAHVNADGWMYPIGASEPTDWRSALSAAQAPASLTDPQQRFRTRMAPELDAIVVELRQNVDAGDQRIRDFLASAEQQIRDNHPTNIILDMRQNTGGDLNNTRAFVQGLPALASGRIFVLTSPWTFSAAISTVGYLEQAAPERVTIVGEHVGDRLDFFAEGRPVRLPHSGLMVLPATQRHDYANGCRAYSDCHPPVVRNPIAVASLAPDIAAPWTIEAYLAGRDPAMEAVAAALR